MNKQLGPSNTNKVMASTERVLAPSDKLWSNIRPVPTSHSIDF